MKGWKRTNVCQPFSYPVHHLFLNGALVGIDLYNIGAHNYICWVRKGGRHM